MSYDSDFSEFSLSTNYWWLKVVKILLCLIHNICCIKKACIYWYAEQTIPNYTFCDLTISSILAHASTKGNKRKRILPKGRRFYAMKIAKNLFKMQKKMKPNMEMTFLRHFVIERQVAEFIIYIQKTIFSILFSIFVELFLYILSIESGYNEIITLPLILAAKCH